MMKDKIIADFNAYFSQHVRSWREVYVGVTKDARGRLFNGHGVKENGDAWIYRQADSSAAARDVEAYFLKLGADGGAGGGDATADYVYGYKKAPHTNP